MKCILLLSPLTMLWLLPKEVLEHWKDDAFCHHLSSPNIVPEWLLGFSGFCSCIFRSPKSPLATRILNIHRAETRDPMGGVITQSLSHCVSKAFHILTLGLKNFYWNFCFLQVETNLFAESKIFRAEGTTTTYSLTCN